MSELAMTKMGGSAKFASGSFTPTSNLTSYSMNIDFEPDVASVQTTTYNGGEMYCLISIICAFDINRAMSVYIDSAVRIKGTTSKGAATYANGVLTFLGASNKQFLANETYYWYASKE